MEHSEHYEEVLKYYKLHFWTLNMVRNAVVKGWITPEEFFEITGMLYY